MKVSDNVRKKLQQKDVLDLIDEEKYEELYNNFNSSERGELTEFLLQCSIKPDDHMLQIPEKYMGWSNASSYNISKGVERIGTKAFYACYSLTSVTIPDSVKSIGDGAFLHCTSLRNITLPDGITSIGEDTFYDCTCLTNIVIPNSVTSIGKLAFKKCTSLKSITIPDSVTSIGDGAFESCRSLTSITIPNSVTSIGKGVFCSCSKLRSITIGNSVQSMGGSFSGCTELMSITVDAGNTTYHVAGNCLIETASKTLISGCKNSVIPTDGSVTRIGEHPFSNCANLKSIAIPDSITSIGEYAFYNCRNLDIQFDGTRSQWKEIARGKFKGCTYICNCSDGVVKKSR